MGDKASDMTAERDTEQREEFLRNLETAREACAALGDEELARHVGRTILAALAGAADGVLRDGGESLRAAPDKVGAFFDRIAAAFVATLEGVHKRAAATDAPVAGGYAAPYRPRETDPLAKSFPAWAPAPRERGAPERA
jgi:hypothetical protein